MMVTLKHPISLGNCPTKEKIERPFSAYREGPFLIYELNHSSLSDSTGFILEACNAFENTVPNATKRTKNVGRTNNQGLTEILKEYWSNQFCTNR